MAGIVKMTVYYLKILFFFLNQLLILSKIKFRAQKLKDFLQFKKFKVDFLL